MKLSNKARYGVQAVFDIAFHSQGAATQIRQIAERQAIPPRFLEQIFQDLKRAGLVSSKRGPRGGYRLARPAAQICVGDVVRALEGPFVLAAPTSARAEGDPTSRAALDETFAALAERLERCLDSVTFEDLCERGQALGGQGATQRLVYAI